MGAPCPTLSPLGGIGITIAEREREAGDQISWRDSARGQKCRVSALVLSMTMAWMPLAVPMEFFVRGHGRDDFDLSFVTYLTYLTYTIPPTYLPTYLYYLLPQSDSACAHPSEPRLNTDTYLTLPVHSLPTYLTSTSTIHNHVKRLLHRPQHRSWSGIDRRNRLLCITRKHVRSLHDKTKGGGRETAD